MIESEDDTSVATLSNGVRVVTIRLPHLASVSVSVFVRTGSRHESPRLNGISHVVEHMAFKGTESRDARAINLDAERLGAQVNAHTDKDHTAYHIGGLVQHTGIFIEMLGDIVRASVFPEDELERERQVILQEYIEDEDDPLSTAFKLFDKVCFGDHPLAQPVIGTRRNIERFTRNDLLGYVRSQYSGANVVVGVAGNVDPAAVVDAVRAAFGSMPAGSENGVAAPGYVGGVRTRRQAGSSQSHVVMGYPIGSLHGDWKAGDAGRGDQAGQVAAALFGEGMSSPLLHEIRERRGLVYYASCTAEVTDLAGLFTIEASTTPEHLDEFCAETFALLSAQARAVDAVDLERARNQIAVRRLRAHERPWRRLEDSAQDLFVFGRIRSRAELTEQVEAVTARQLRRSFEQMLAAPASIALAGRVPRGAPERLQSLTR